MKASTILFAIGLPTFAIGLLWLHPALFFIVCGAGCLWGSFEETQKEDEAERANKELGE